ncbi:phytoene/squalene synthase family protein [Silvibacterium dinghuense]|uniref:Phytoene/squalene synthase family protein n=1 Tax=Silvibacterium dinghuense TaxID=1560006 RepID=A0A4Q1SE02_9BACT|nr:phytoene/squalene synthase family protein [Silvibacterium dinghuense]RXS95301.1 phytoene/squalene synthase family protein [Silvibacterium dinghuense]GGH12259.1 phytoene desaturase [Silvibacterium dinghuense]
MSSNTSPIIQEAYRTCREIARREAKNFYYSFLALPEVKRNAICAVYAFMRHADDISDDERVPLSERRRTMEDWLAAWHAAAQGGATADPVFIALRDAQARFAIPHELLDQLVEGVTMDLRRDVLAVSDIAAMPLETYERFDELYRYCYLVASVVGLVCIRIFGYHDPRAEKLAEETGIAFQITNILRDVKEDVERRRVYLPLEDLRAHGVELDALTALADHGGVPDERVRNLLAFEANRAEHYYKSGQALLPFISADARPALWVLIRIYYQLLREIERKRYDVFTARVQVSTAKKLGYLALGILRTLVVRLKGI